MAANNPAKDKTGRLYQNERSSDRAPHWTGYVFVNGEKFDVAAWHYPPQKEGDRATISLRLSTQAEVLERRAAYQKGKPKTLTKAAAVATTPEQQQRMKKGDFDDEIPF